MSDTTSIALITLTSCSPAQALDPVQDLETAQKAEVLVGDVENAGLERLQGIARILAIGAARAVSKGGGVNSPVC